MRAIEERDTGGVVEGAPGAPGTEGEMGESAGGRDADQSMVHQRDVFMEVEERKERRKVIAEVLKGITGIQAPPAQDRLRKTLSRGAQHSELLRWLIVYNERIRRLIQEEPTREVVVREGDAPAKVYSVTFGEERPLAGAAWRFYFVAAIMSILEAAKFSRALGQSHYLRMEPAMLRDADRLFGLDATLVQGANTWLMKVSRHDRELEDGTLEDELRRGDHQRAQILLRNRVCVTTHRGGIYRIIDVTDQTADTTHFERGGSTVSVTQYFREAHRQNVEGKQVPTGGRARKVPKSAQSTLKDYVEIMDQLLTNEAVKEQMSELKIQIGDNNLPVNVQAHTTSLQKLMGDVPSYGRPRLSWGSVSPPARGTDVGLGVDFQRELLRNLTLRHKVPLSAQWMLVICTSDREHEGARVEQDILDTIRRTRGRPGTYTFYMFCCLHQVSVQVDFPIQCCKIETLRRFKKGEDKSFNVWWNVFIQFQTKIIERKAAGIPWVADDLLAPIKEQVGKQETETQKLHEIASIRTFLEAELGKFTFSHDTHELTLEHPMATAFLDAKYYLKIHTCPVADVERCKHKAEGLGSQTQPALVSLNCDRAREGSNGKHALTFKVGTGSMPYYGRYAVLTCMRMTNPETFKVEGAGEEKYIVLPDTHPILKYARANLRWLGNIAMQFATDPKEAASVVSPFASIIGPLDTISPKFFFDKKCEWNPGTTVYLRRVFISHVVQRVHLNVMINPHRPASPLKFFMSNHNTVQGLAVGAYIDSGPIIPVSPDTGMLEEKFLIGTADPSRGSPSASEFQIITNDSDWSKNYLAVVSFKLCHLYYNWAGTVKHPHLLQMAIAIVRQHQIYIASGSGFGLESEFDLEGQPPEQEETAESPEEGEEPEIQERRQKRRHEEGRFTVTSEQREILAQQEAGRQNLEELKAALQSRESVLMTTAFML
ncbi:hypothetical protein Emed_004202 [Eimeria media]